MFSEFGLYFVLVFPAVTSYTYSAISTWQQTSNPTPPDASLISWQSAFWALIPLALTAATMENSTPPFAMDQLSHVLRVSPVFCGFDSLYKIIEARLFSPVTGWVKLAETPPHTSSGEERSPQILSRRTSITRYILLALSLTQSLKVFASAGIFWTQIQALIFVSHIIWTAFLSSSSSTLFPHVAPMSRNKYIETPAARFTQTTLSRSFFVAASLTFAIQPHLYPFVSAYRYRGQLLALIGTILYYHVLPRVATFPPGGKVVMMLLIASLDSLRFAALERDRNEGVVGIWAGADGEKWSGTGGLVVLYACVPLIALVVNILRFGEGNGRKVWWFFAASNVLSTLLVYQQCFDSRGTWKPEWVSWLG